MALLGPWLGGQACGPLPTKAWGPAFLEVHFVGLLARDVGRTEHSVYQHVGATIVGAERLFVLLANGDIGHASAAKVNIGRVAIIVAGVEA